MVALFNEVPDKQLPCLLATSCPEESAQVDKESKGAVAVKDLFFTPDIAGKQSAEGPKAQASANRRSYFGVDSALVSWAQGLTLSEHEPCSWMRPAPSPSPYATVACPGGRTA